MWSGCMTKINLDSLRTGLFVARAIGIKCMQIRFPNEQLLNVGKKFILYKFFTHKAEITCRSSPAEAKCLPCEEKATAQTLSVWPVSV